MSATFTTTSYLATSRSLHTSFNAQKGIHGKERKHARLIAVFAILFLSLVLSGGLCAAETQNAKNGNNADILRQDILRLVGPVTDARVQNATVPTDSFLVRLNRQAPAVRTESAEFYGMLVRGLDATEQALFQDAKDGKWDNFTLFQAAMVAEGIRDPEQIRRYENRLDTLLAGVRAKLEAGGDLDTPENLTRELFEALHRDILTKPYDINCTHLGQVLETGHFNCVSATVLFNVLAEKAGLDVCALEMPGHALSRVKFVGGSMNVETTAPNWFALQTEASRSRATLHRVARPVSAQPLPVTGNRQVEAPTVDSVSELNTLSQKLREITPVQLIATIYYNQGVDLLQEKRHPEAALANVKALHLDPSSETAWGNLMATLNNWSIELTTEAKRYDLAATLLDQGVYLDPNYDKFKANQVYVYYHWIHALALEGRTADAKTVFGYADQRLPGDKDLAKLMQTISKM